MSGDAVSARRGALVGRRALVMGLGAFGGGLGSARYLAARGADVTATDLRTAAELPPEIRELEDLGVRLVLGHHRHADFAAAELVVPNPAVSPENPFLKTARDAGARIVSSVELFLAATRGDVVGITGTQGKSSTSHLLADLLGAALAGTPRRVHLGGNIGGSLLERVDEIQAGDLVVMELSSYQLDALSPEAPRRLVAAAVVNVLADHLERHGTPAAYRAAKLRLLELVAPGGTVCLPAELARDPDVRAALPSDVLLLSINGSTELATSGSGEPGLALTAEDFVLRGERLAPRAALSVPGAFQHANALVALGLARALGIEPDVLARALPAAGVPEHRLQDLGLRGPLRVWDNAVSTTPDSTLAALESVAGSVLLLVGGRRKSGLDLGPMARAAAARARLTIVFGEAGEALEAALVAAGAAVLREPDVPSAVAAAYERGAVGEALLFSPACSSFDAYPNFQARAQHFRALLPPPSDAGDAPRTSATATSPASSGPMLGRSSA